MIEFHSVSQPGGMDRKLPNINVITLQDGTYLPVQIMRRLASTDKLPVPHGARLSLTRGKLGESVSKISAIKSGKSRVFPRGRTFIYVGI